MNKLHFQNPYPEYILYIQNSIPIPTELNALASLPGIDISIVENVYFIPEPQSKQPAFQFSGNIKALNFHHIKPCSKLSSEQEDAYFDGIHIPYLSSFSGCRPLKYSHKIVPN